MSEIQAGMNFEFLPNEIFIECFEYLNAPEIFYSFDQLNYRFSKLIRTIPLHLGCEHVRKSIFDQFCRKMLSTPEIKTQIRSLHLSNDNTCVSIKRFLSLFSLNEFSHLRSFTLTEVKSKNVEQLQLVLPLLPELNCFRLMDRVTEVKILLSVVQISQLRTLSAHSLNSFLTSSDGILSIKNLTISQCSFYEARYLFLRAPMLRHLNVRSLLPNCMIYYIPYIGKCVTNDYAIYLKQMIIDRFIGGFDELTTLLKQIPNLKSLNISNSTHNDMIDACRWEDFITSSLPQLTIFKFKFSSNYEDDIPDKFKQFQSEFWHQQHHWYTEYTLDEGSGYIYTIPYISNTYELTSHTERYQNQLMNNVNTFDNVSDVILYKKAILLKNSYYFSNVTSLELRITWDFKDIDEELLSIEHIYSLKTIVNLSNLRHLSISSNCRIDSSSVFLQLLKETSQLSSMKISLNRLQSLFGDEEVCKYLNKRIVKLDILYSYEYFASYDQLNEFCQIFSNLEYLICYITRENDLSFLINHLPKLSIMKIHLSELIDRHWLTPRLKNEARKLQLKIYLEFENEFSQTVRIWIDRNMY